MKSSAYQDDLLKPNGRFLYLFTNSFPYGSGEVFVGNELPYLASTFQEVFIQPFIGQGAKRDTPHNVTIFKPLASKPSSKLSLYIKYSAFFATYKLFFRESLRALTKHHRLHPDVFRTIFTWSIYRVALSKSDGATHAIANSFPRVAYSYWGHVPSLAIPTLSRYGIPSAVRFHRADLYSYTSNSFPVTMKKGRYFPWYDDVSCYASRLLFISEHGRSYFHANWPSSYLGENKSIVCRLGIVDHGIPRDLDRNRESLIIVSCSRIAPVKRVSYIAELAIAISNFQKVEWHHFGDGNCPRLTKVLESYSKERFYYRLWGRTLNETIIDFYKKTRVDLFVNLSESEGVPVSIMEALSMNIPVLATDVEGNSEIVFDGKSGLLCTLAESSNAAKLASRVRSEFSDGGLIFRSRPREVWEKLYNADTNYRLLSDMLLNLTNV